MKERTAITILAVFLTVMCGMAVYAAASAGSADDPIVTKSYVDKAVNDALSAFEKNHSDGGGSVTGSAPDQGYSFEVVKIKEGERLICGEGTEIVVRSGKASAIDNGKDGISDISTGADLKTGDAAESNHLLIVPRSDGRGIKASTEVYAMVKGAYQIKRD